MTEIRDDIVLARLRDGLRDESLLSNGRVLPERQLAERLGLGRARLRRLLDVLEGEGTIFRRQGQGTFAAPPPVGGIETLVRQVTPHNLMEVRLEIEPALAALAAQRATAEELGVLERLMQATLSPGEVRAYETADDIFHFKIAELAHNPLFLTIHQSIRSVRRHAQWTERRRETLSAERIAQLGQQHEALFDHIAGRRPAEAAAEMERHLLSVSSTMLRVRRHEAGAAE
ncbi:FadR/GntR family transcriptional regulator [Limimaricola hongkongensis]|uniref:Transcriptional regulator, GntR family n=1 Tax=Limimaricola hongkongensis DSM 17492 TaxID=1122180 RepID=A0A017H8D3_9RHOB|nr:FCD domain-containing protein [Limimaricola hongkongensis]EYD70433.1 Transcriptional regulator, GntR family [Limimaricola hongkongensis DSM 17492]